MQRRIHYRQIPEGHCFLMILGSYCGIFVLPALQEYRRIIELGGDSEQAMWRALIFAAVLPWLSLVAALPLAWHSTHKEPQLSFLSEWWWGFCVILFLLMLLLGALAILRFLLELVGVQVF